VRCWILACLVACAPHIDGPLDQQHARDRADAAVLERELGHLTGVRAAHVALSRVATDPFTGARTAQFAGAVLLVDARTDLQDTSRAATVLLHGVAPDIEPAIAVQIAARPLERSRPWPLAFAFGAIAILAGWLAWRERHRVMVRS
jgi:hypothetical protein